MVLYGGFFTFSHGPQSPIDNTDINYWPYRATQVTYLASKQEWRPLNDRNIN